MRMTFTKIIHRVESVPLSRLSPGASLDCPGAEIPDTTEPQLPFTRNIVYLSFQILLLPAAIRTRSQIS